MLLETALLCLSLNIYFEARGEPIPGQYAVAQVTMNRAKQSHTDVCNQVLKPKQFSWTTEKVEYVNGRARLKKDFHPNEQYAFQVAKIIAVIVLTGKIAGDLSEGAEFYHAEVVKPPWRSSFVKVKQIGKHIFYRRT
jgi:spore germination cell wall hydrolase CwlJ-like protein